MVGQRDAISSVDRRFQPARRPPSWLHREPPLRNCPARESHKSRITRRRSAPLPISERATGTFQLLAKTADKFIAVDNASKMAEFRSQLAKNTASRISNTDRRHRRSTDRQAEKAPALTTSQPPLSRAKRRVRTSTQFRYRRK